MLVKVDKYKDCPWDKADINAHKSKGIQDDRDISKKLATRHGRRSLIAVKDEDIRMHEKEEKWNKFFSANCEKKMPLECGDTALHRAVGNADTINKTKGRNGA